MDVAQALMPERGRQLLSLSSGQAVLRSRCAGGSCSASLQTTTSPQTVEVVGLVQVGHGDDLLAAPNDAQQGREENGEAGRRKAGHRHQVGGESRHKADVRQLDDPIRLSTHCRRDADGDGAAAHDRTRLPSAETTCGLAQG